MSKYRKNRNNWLVLLFFPTIKSGIINDFPRNPGVYVITRKNDYSIQPIVLYVGKTTSKRSIRDRLGDHFSKNEPNVEGSQFCKILTQIYQNEECVKDILWNENTLVSYASLLNENDEIITKTCELAKQELKPKFNV